MRRWAAFATVLAWLAACASYSSEDAPVVPVAEAGTPGADAAGSDVDGSSPPPGDAGDASDGAGVDAAVVDASDGGVDAAKNCVATLERSPTTVVTSGTGEAWKNTAKVFAADNSTSDADLTNGIKTSQTLFASTFGFAVPAGASIVGVVVRLRGNSSESDDDIRDESIKLTPNGTASGTNKAAKTWRQLIETTNYGDASSVWELALTPEIVNSPVFGVAYIAKYYGASIGTMHIDQLTMTITYCQ